MDLEASKRYTVLEQMLIDENVGPTDLPLSLLEDITDHFSPNHEIGSGGFGVVYKGIIGKGMVAVKKLSKTIDIVHENKFHKEIECLMKAKHKNIVRFLGYCAEAHGKAADYEGKFVIADLRNWLLCFEYLPKGSLEKYITNASSGLEWKERFRIIKGICEGLHYLHMNRILHLDLKPANILLDGHMVPKLADFGLSRCLDEEKTHGTTQHLIGTPGYMATEFYSGKFTFASDIYSLGVIIMEILTGMKGYPEDDNVTESWMNRLEGDMELEQVRVCTKIVIECMESDPKKRPVSRRIVYMLDKTASADEIGMSSPLVELQESLLKEQSDQERKLAGSPRQEDIKEHHETEDVAERVGNYHSQEGEENTNRLSWEAQDIELKVSHKGKSIFSSNSSVFDKLKFLNIFRRDARKNFARNQGRVPQIRGLTIFTKLGQADKTSDDSLQLVANRQFTYQELERITNGFDRVLGQGGFGRVYDGFLEDGTQVAVKLRSHSSNQGVKEFLAEAQTLTRIHHKNLVSMIGYCKDGEYMALVYEYMAQGTLREHIAGSDHNGGCLPWRQRVKIALGSAQGLEYLHTGCNPPLIHKDVNTTNILLNASMEAKIGDFGLSEAFDYHNTTHVSNDYLVGTPGYIDPEYYATFQPTTKSDVYSFGVVILELVTGKPAILSDPELMSIIYWTRQRMAWGNMEGMVDAGGNMEGVVDARMHGCYNVNSVWNVAEIALKCTAEGSVQRPTMSNVVAWLQECVELEEAHVRGFHTSGDDNYNAYASAQSTNVSSNTAFETELRMPRVAADPGPTAC